MAYLLSSANGDLVAFGYQNYLGFNYLSILYQDPDQQEVLWNIYNSTKDIHDELIRMNVSKQSYSNLLSL